MPTVDTIASGGWECSWEAARKRQRLAQLGATPAERLAWLEEAIALAHASGALPRRREQPASRSRGA